MIPVGTAWREEIDAALDHCDFGLLLLSSGFLASRSISNQELPHFLGPDPDGSIRIHKPIVPVGLKFVPLDGSADLKGLDQTQIFRDSQDHWFNQTRGHISETFADELIRAISTKLKAHP